MASQVLRTGIPAVVKDIKEKPIPVAWRAALQELAITSVGAFPLIIRDRPVGVLSL